MRRVFTTRHVDRWMRKTELTVTALCAAVVEMEQGLVDADLGGGVVKKRVSLPGRGKSGGARTLVATNRGSRWFFVFGFEKNERANVSPGSSASGEARLAGRRAIANRCLRPTRDHLLPQPDKEAELEGLKGIGADLPCPLCTADCQWPGNVRPGAGNSALKLVPKQLDELIATEAIKEICHDC